MNGFRYIFEMQPEHIGDSHRSLVFSSEWYKKEKKTLKIELTNDSPLGMEIVLKSDSQNFAQLAVALLADCAEQGIDDPSSLCELIDGIGNVDKTVDLLKEIIRGLGT